MLGFIAVGVHDAGKADVRVPAQSGVQTAIVAPLANSFGIRAFAKPFEVHAPAGAVGVARHQMVLVLVRPWRPVFVLGAAQIALCVIGI